MNAIRPLKRLAGGIRRFVQGPEEPPRPYRCIKCGQGYEKPRNRCSSCGGQFVVSNESE